MRSKLNILIFQGFFFYLTFINIFSYKKRNVYGEMLWINQSWTSECFKCINIELMDVSNLTFWLKTDLSKVSDKPELWIRRHHTNNKTEAFKAA